VFVVQTDEAGHTRARTREVKVEAMHGDEVVIRNGIAAGERVAASGSFKLRDQALVAVTPPIDKLAMKQSDEADSG
jgi:membrane fusion protein (multidrug efflux system)